MFVPNIHECVLQYLGNCKYIVQCKLCNHKDTKAKSARCIKIEVGQQCKKPEGQYAKHLAEQTGIRVCIAQKIKQSAQRTRNISARLVKTTFILQFFCYLDAYQNLCIRAFQ